MTPTEHIWDEMDRDEILDEINHQQGGE